MCCTYDGRQPNKLTHLKKNTLKKKKPVLKVGVGKWCLPSFPKELEIRKGK